MNSFWDRLKNWNIWLITLIIAIVFVAAIYANRGNEYFARDFLSDLASELIVAFVVIAGLEVIIHSSTQQTAQSPPNASTGNEEKPESE